MTGNNSTTLHEPVNNDDKEVNPCKFLVEHGIFSILLAFLIVVTNVIILLSIWRKRCQQQSTNSFLAGLATCDSLTGFLGIPVFIACNSTFFTPICMASNVLAHFISILTVLHIVLITTDRYISIIYSMRYHDLFTYNRAKKALIAIWLFASVTASSELLWLDYSTEIAQDGNDTEKMASKVFFTLCFILFFIVPFLWMVYCYARILHEVYKQRKRIKRFNFPSARRVTRERSQPVHRSRPVAIYVIIFATYIFSWFPYHLLKMEMVIQSKSFQIHLSEAMLYFFSYCRFLEPLLNPFVYTLGKKDLRKAVSLELKRLVRKVTCREESGHRLRERDCIAQHLEETRDTLCLTPRLQKKNSKTEQFPYNCGASFSPSVSLRLSPSGSFAWFYQ